MKKRIEDKIQEIETYLAELDEIKPDDFNGYLNDKKTKAACERYFEKITEACVDLAFLLIKHLGLNLPEDDKESFSILAENEVINVTLSDKFKDAKGMRNIIAHQYGSVDDEIVFEAITSELDRDVRIFIKAAKNIE